MEKISADVRSLMRSSVNVTNFSDAVSELVYNSLDANADSIAVRVNIKKYKIQVVDNGQGIHAKDMEQIGIRYMTSKCKTLQDLKSNKLKTFGFRGEALSSIVDISEEVSIESLHCKDNKTYSKVFHKGVDQGKCGVKKRPSQGTTVTITNFMYNMGVRQRGIEPIRELEEIRDCLSKIALLHYYVSFTLRDDSDGKLVLKTHKSSSVREASSYLFDGTTSEALVPVNVQNGLYTMEGYVSKTTITNQSFQYIYLNKKYVKNCSITKYCNELLKYRCGSNLELNKNDQKKDKWFNFNFKSTSNKKKHLSFIINFMCPRNEYEIIGTTEETRISFKNETKVKGTVKLFVDYFFNKFIKDVGDGEGCIVKDITDDEERNILKEGKKMKRNKMPLENIENVIKDILNKNVDNFGASQMNNAVKGKPAMRRHKLDMAKKNKIHSDKYVTPINRSSKIIHTSNFRKPKHRNKNSVESQTRVLNDNQTVKHMRETPFILSQICLKAKTITKSKRLNGHNEIRNRDVGINVNISSKQISITKHNKHKIYCASIHQNIRALVKRSRRNRLQTTTESNIFHVNNYDSHKNYNQGNQVFNNFQPNINNKMDSFFNLTKNDQHLSHMPSFEEFNEFFKMFQNQFSRKKRSTNTMKKPLVKKSSDMIKTVIPEKSKNVVQCIQNQSTDPFSIFLNEIECKKQPMEDSDRNLMDCHKYLKNSSVQTLLKLEDMNFLVDKEMTIVKQCTPETPTKMKCLYNSAPNIRFKDSYLCKDLQGSKENIDSPKNMVVLESFTLENITEDSVSSTLKDRDEPYLNPNNFLEIVYEEPIDNDFNLEIDQTIRLNSELENGEEKIIVIDESEMENDLEKAISTTEINTLKNCQSRKSSSSLSMFKSIVLDEEITLVDKLMINEISENPPIVSNMNDAPNIDTIQNQSIENTENIEVNHNILSNIEVEEKKSPLKNPIEWEIRTDSLGKVYYVNHRTGMTLYENPENAEETGFKFFKRPNFVPKGLSPILKLGEDNWVFGNYGCNIDPLAANKIQETEMLAKMKYGHFYYTEATYNEFVCGIQNNLTELDDLNDVSKYKTLHMHSKRLKLGDDFRFRREMLHNVEVINQVDKKFICGSVVDSVAERRYIVLFDQHAVHERVQLETIKKDHRLNGAWKSITLAVPLKLKISRHDLPLLMKHKKGFEDIGLIFSIKSMDQAEIDIKTLPLCFQYIDLKEETNLAKSVERMICEELDVIKNSKGSVSSVPETIMRIISSRACHTAIKFGMQLSKEQCKNLIHQLSGCEVPFQCAHGRPVLSVLFTQDMKMNCQQIKKLNFKNMKKFLQKK